MQAADALTTRVEVFGHLGLRRREEVRREEPGTTAAAVDAVEITAVPSSPTTSAGVRETIAAVGWACSPAVGVTGHSRRMVSVAGCSRRIRGSSGTRTATLRFEHVALVPAVCHRGEETRSPRRGKETRGATRPCRPSVRRPGGPRPRRQAQRPSRRGGALEDASTPRQGRARRRAAGRPGGTAGRPGTPHEPGGEEAQSGGAAPKTQCARAAAPEVDGADEDEGGGEPHGRSRQPARHRLKIVYRFFTPPVAPAPMPLTLSAEAPSRSRTATT